MNIKEIEWRIGNLKRQVQEHLHKEVKLSEYPDSVYVESTMRKNAESEIAELEKQLT